LLGGISLDGSLGRGAQDWVSGTVGEVDDAGCFKVFYWDNCLGGKDCEELSWAQLRKWLVPTSKGEAAAPQRYVLTSGPNLSPAVMASIPCMSGSAPGGWSAAWSDRCAL